MGAANNPEIICQDLLNHMNVKIALDTLQKKAFRNELSCLPGYDAFITGKILKKF